MKNEILETSLIQFLKHGIREMSYKSLFFGLKFNRGKSMSSPEIAPTSLSVFKMVFCKNQDGMLKCQNDELPAGKFQYSSFTTLPGIIEILAFPCCALGTLT